MRLIKFVVYSNILISISAGMLCFGICKKLRIEHSELYGLFVFGATLFTYNFQRIIKQSFTQFDSSERLIWIEKHLNFLKILSAIGFIGSSIIYFCYLFRLKTFYILVALGVISILYAFKFFGKTKMNLRDIPMLKIHWICLVWVGACAVFPILNENVFVVEHLYLFVGLYLYILAITIPFDIRDFALDNENQKTIPQVLGIAKSKILAVIALLIGGVLISFSLAGYGFLKPLLILAIGLQLQLILNSNSERKELYFSGAIDGSIILLGLCFLEVYKG